MDYPQSRPGALAAVPLVAPSTARAPLAEGRDATAFQFWWHSVRVPFSLFLFAAAVLATTNVDLDVARWFFFDSVAHQWRGAGNWWVNELVHVGGRWLVRGVVLAALMVWAGAFTNERRRHWRRPAGYFAIAVLLTVGSVGLLKHLTNVDCAWDLAAFGGRFPHVHLFAHRPPELPRAQCFPAAHASSGYALMALYFAFLERSRRLALAGLAGGVAMGLVFGLAQQSRGAHLLSHDVWSAMIAWLISVSIYTFAFRRCLWRRDSPGRD